MLQLQLLRKTPPLSLCHVPQENWVMGVRRYSGSLSSESGDADKVVQ
jgi:hypothetical protein